MNQSPEWKPIPAGKVTLITKDDWPDNYVPKGQPSVFDVPAFAMAKYPTTNAQYAIFMQDGGYTQRRWWSAAGWTLSQREKWTQPRLWKDARFNGQEQPVVGVSWYEAMAFCAWLSDRLSEPVFLPTEQQWQRAAQGDDGRLYAWGSDWDCTRCNNSISPCDSDATTPVRQYEKAGLSPFGVADMTGNVWEWCLTAYEMGSHHIDGEDGRVLRGGSWAYNLTSDLQVIFRGHLAPVHWDNHLGFRCVRSSLV